MVAFDGFHCGILRDARCCSGVVSLVCVLLIIVGVLYEICLLYLLPDKTNSQLSLGAPCLLLLLGRTVCFLCA